MTVRLTQQKIHSIADHCKEIMQKKFVTIAEFAQLVGKLVAAEPGVEYAPLYYKPLEREKDRNLKLKHGNYNSFMKLTASIKQDIQWWVDNLQTSFRKVSHENPSLVLHTDASLKGYGACIKEQNAETSGVWSVHEQNLHINVLELKACHLALLALCHARSNIHIRIYTDNTTCCAYINKFGGKCRDLNKISREIWRWCLDRNIHLSAAHVAGIANTEADRLSRLFNDDLEWSLHTSVFKKILSVFGHLDIDMFASRLNNKLDCYVSRLPEPFAWAIDAFSLDWSEKLLYMFPPFSLISRILQKILQDKAEVVLVAPIWTTQGWWAQLLHMLSHQSYILPPAQQILALPHKPDRIHPLRKMVLGAFRLSGKRCKSKAYQSSLSTLSSVDGDLLHKDNMQPSSNGGYTFAIGDRIVPLNHL